MTTGNGVSESFSKPQTTNFQGSSHGDTHDSTHMSHNRRVPESCDSTSNRCDDKPLFAHSVAPPTTSSSPSLVLLAHGVPLEHPGHHAGREDETSLPVHQERMRSGATAISSGGTQGFDPPGAQGPSSRSSQEGGHHCSSRGQHHHGGDQERQVGHPAPYVCGSGHWHQPQDHGWGDEVGSSPMADRVRHGRHHLRDWPACRGHLQRAHAQQAGLHSVGHQGGPDSTSGRLAPDAAGALGHQDAAQHGSLERRRGVCHQGDQTELGSKDEANQSEGLNNDAVHGHFQPGRCSDQRHDEHDENHDGPDPGALSGAPGGEVLPGRQFLFCQGPQDHEHQWGLRRDRSGGVLDEGFENSYQEPACQTAWLTDAESARVRESIDQLVPNCWASVTDTGRLFLLEVACSPNSTLTTEAQKQGLSADRAALFNGHDLTTPEGLRKTLTLISQKRPKNVCISTECGAFPPCRI